MPEDIGQQAALELFEAAPCGYLFTAPDGTITKVNETFLCWTGYSRADLLGHKRFQDLLTLPAKIFYETHFAPLLRMQGYVKEITVDIVCKNGVSLPTLVNSTIQPDKLGKPSFIRTTLFDIRERRRYERELLIERRKAEQLASVVEDASDAIITVTGEHVVQTWNRGAQSLFGYAAEEALGRNLCTLIVPQAMVDAFKRQVGVLDSGGSLSYETILLNREGESLEVSVTITSRIDAPDELAGFSLIARDVRVRKKEEEVRQSRRDLELANHLAHEINNPLQALVNCLVILSSEENSEFVELARQQAERVARVVLDLVKLTGDSEK
jgi:PAS domain S-box-containing protein